MFQNIRFEFHSKQRSTPKVSFCIPIGGNVNHAFLTDLIMLQVWKYKKYQETFVTFTASGYHKIILNGYWLILPMLLTVFSRFKTYISSGSTNNVKSTFTLSFYNYKNNETGWVYMYYFMLTAYFWYICFNYDACRLYHHHQIICLLAVELHT